MSKKEAQKQGPQNLSSGSRSLPQSAAQDINVEDYSASELHN